MDGNAQPSPFCPECRSNGCCEWAELRGVVGPASPCRPYDDGIDDTRRVKAAAHAYPGGRLTSGHGISRTSRIPDPDRKSVVEGKSGSGRVDIGRGGDIKKTKKKNNK